MRKNVWPHVRLSACIRGYSLWSGSGRGGSVGRAERMEGRVTLRPFPAAVEGGPPGNA